MIIYNNYIKEEPYSSLLDEIIDDCNDSFKLKKGDKIAILTGTTPFFKIIIEMETGGIAVSDYVGSIGIIVERKLMREKFCSYWHVSGMANVSTIVYNIVNTQSDLELLMMEFFKLETRLDDAGIKELIEEMKEKHIVGVLGNPD